MNFKIIITLIVAFIANSVFSANILYVTPVASPSHHVWNRVLAFGLIERGHNVTMLTHDAEKDPLPKNFTIILLEGIYQKRNASLDIDALLSQTPMSNVPDMYNWGLYVCKHDITTKGLATLLNYPADFKFDLIVFDVTLGQCLYPLIERFRDPPVVAVTPFLLPPVLLRTFGNNLYSSYMPFYNSQFTNIMSFKERLLNFIYVYYELIYRNYVFLSRATEIAKKRFGENIRSLEETERKMGMLLCNIDIMLDYPIALPPNIIPIGGLQVKAPKELPKDLQEILDKAEHGAILFSLGTNLRADNLDLNKRKAFLDAFARIPQIVLWKFGSNITEDLPKNVIIRNWLPQNDILGHPNLKLFISHVGTLSTQEAIYHGIPILGMPIFSDQKVNIAKMEHRMLAIYVDIKNISFEIMYEKLIEMLNNPIYYNNVKKVSELYRDQPQAALDRALFWIEHVLRHGTAEHLVSVARDMPSYKINNLDVLAVLALCLTLLYSFVMLILTGLRFILTFRRQNKKQKISKTK
ncbi:hypothetical protein ILUMI_19724 [Ignelater luminosus]|uniref:UDP-glucuronosyltransferase n=1 Tax=Ignelater luminosus TaxID=2038154 RepID=A0A8K0CFM7_IGNLU|nr:hypothetical protein ILUMI_19724 [Ignelater luminosus]